MPASPVAKTTASTAPADQGAGGLPQFDPQWWAGEIFWFLVIFGLVFALMGKVFAPRIARTIDQREDRIAGDIGAARKLRDEAEAQAAAAAAETAQARVRAQKLAAEARARANAEIASVQAAEEAKLAESTAAAEVAIRTARDQAMTNVRKIARDTARAIVEKLTGEKPDADEVEAALAERA
jgi:F-type H+-transporting ATPase subunit b